MLFPETAEDGAPERLASGSCSIPLFQTESGPQGGGGIFSASLVNLFETPQGHVVPGLLIQSELKAKWSLVMHKHSLLLSAHAVKSMFITTDIFGAVEVMCNVMVLNIMLAHTS